MLKNVIIFFNIKSLAFIKKKAIILVHQMYSCIEKKQIFHKEMLSIVYNKLPIYKCIKLLSNLLMVKQRHIFWHTHF